MSQQKTSASHQSKEQIRDTMVYNIWLAGLGAYAKSSDEVNQLSDRGKSLFDELIERGKKIEAKTKERVHTARSQTSVAIEERMHTMVQKFIGIDNERLDRVDDKIDQLTETIEGLLAKQQTKPAATKATTTRTRSKKAATTNTKTTTNVARRKPAKTARPVAEKAIEPEKNA